MLCYVYIEDACIHAQCTRVRTLVPGTVRVHRQSEQLSPKCQRCVTGFLTNWARDFGVISFCRDRAIVLL